MRAPFAISVLALALATTAAQAHEAGEWIVRAGATYVKPHDSSTALALNGATLTLGGKTSQLEVDNNTQLGLTVSYMLSRDFSVELLAATPFSHAVTGTGALAGLQIADIKQLPPTLSLVYHLPTVGDLQPYVGAGVNYTLFFSEDVTAAAAATLAGLGLKGGALKLDNSTGLSLQAGFDYHLQDNWLLNASLRWIDIDSTAAITFTGGSRLAADVQIDPLVYTVGVGYSF